MGTMSDMLKAVFFRIFLLIFFFYGVGCKAFAQHSPIAQAQDQYAKYDNTQPTCTHGKGPF